MKYQQGQDTPATGFTLRIDGSDRTPHKPSLSPHLQTRILLAKPASDTDE